jgi:hypothetical protein
MASERGNPTTATATVYKSVDGMRTAFTATAAWNEYFPGEAQGFMWKKMPYLMIGKCAEALALRKAFPAELSGVYTNEEMMQADSEPRQSAPRQAPPEPENEPTAPNYGKYAKQPLSAIPDNGLLDYLQGMKRSIDDPKKAKFKAKNIAMLEAIDAELTKRENAASSSAPPTDTPPSQSESDAHQNAPDGAAPSLTAANIVSQLALCELPMEFAQVMNMWEAEKHLHSANDVAEVEKMKTTTKRRLGIRS